MMQYKPPHGIRIHIAVHRVPRRIDFIKEFRICGFLQDADSSREQKVYTSFVSEAFAKTEIPQELSLRRLPLICQTPEPVGSWIHNKYCKS